MWRRFPGQLGGSARRASKQTSSDRPAQRTHPRIDGRRQSRDRLPCAVEAEAAAAPIHGRTGAFTISCITRGVAGSIIPVIYGNGLEIVQAAGYVAIRYEMVHDTRIIPLDGRQHLSKDVHTFIGNPVGHWEGNTLVVETTNLNDKMGGGPNGGGTSLQRRYGADRALHAHARKRHQL